MGKASRRKRERLTKFIEHVDSSFVFCSVNACIGKLSPGRILCSSHELRYIAEFCAPSKYMEEMTKQEREQFYRWWMRERDISIKKREGMVIEWGPPILTYSDVDPSMWPKDPF